MAILLIYSKNEDVRVLNNRNAKMQHEKLIKDGWVHSNTIDSCEILQYLYNNRYNMGLYIPKLENLRTFDKGMEPIQSHTIKEKIKIWLCKKIWSI